MFLVASNHLFTQAMKIYVKVNSIFLRYSYNVFIFHLTFYFLKTSVAVSRVNKV